jgi:hypothetical protein
VIKRIIASAAQKGLDLNVKDNLRSLMKHLGIDPQLVDQTHFELLNEMYKKDFSKVPLSNRIILLPQCLRNSQMCTAKLTPMGLKCNNCGAKCPAWQITQKGKKLGYKGTYISPGGSMAVQILKNMQPHAVVAVACYNELMDGFSRLKSEGLTKVLPIQAVWLTKDGCIDTEVNLETVFNKMELHNPNSKKTEKK